MKSILNILVFDVLSKAILAIISILLINKLTPEEYSKYTYILTYSTLVFQMMFSYFQRKMIFEVKNEEDQIRIACWTALCLLIVAIYSVAVALLVKSLVIALCVFFLSSAFIFYSLLRCYLQKHLNFAFFNFSELLKSSLFFLLVTVLVCFTIRISYLYILAQSISLYVSSLYIMKKKKIDLVSKRGAVINYFKSLRYHKKDAILFIYLVASATITQLGIILAGLLYDDYHVAVYGVSYRYYFMLGMICNASLTFALPSIQKVKSISEVIRIYKLTCGVCLLVLPAFLFAYCYADTIIETINGGKYPESICIFRILLLSSIVNLLFTPFVALLLKLNKYKYLLITSFVALSLFVALSCFGKPFLNYNSVAYGHLLAYTWISVSYVMGFILFKSELFKESCEK